MAEVREPLHSPLTHEVCYTDEESVFLMAMDRYQRLNQRRFPTWREVLRVLHSLGYRRIEQPEPLPRFQRGGS